MSLSTQDYQEFWTRIVDENLKDLQYVLNSCNDEQTVVLRSHLFAEQVLEKIFKETLSKPQYILKKAHLSFYQKLCLAYSIHEINDDSYNSLLLLNRYRNNFAHDLDYELSNKKVIDLGRTLGKEEFKKIKSFANSDIHLLVLIVHKICRTVIIQYAMNKSP